ncbi:branched-chain amino acid ABC transporter permease [Bradyrhizobium sp. 190]|uniref:branched-chain amino acid ABC transporter permease n=1 Tax=Bradyrhizobium sp. 190 TaxID=2782658 RepID=UPI001FF9BADD|nr:branched-chain amino acid ABC transporter permease [Bradyrhizobium sp. 190]MCK1513192.1 branched-chain amino acid ABC transporter permease [Bradyrhizobium sp. 190]
MTFTALMLGVVTGLAFASMFVLISTSLTLVVAASGVFNFAQGTLVMAGAVLAYLLGVNLGWPILAVVAALVGIGVLGGLITYFVAVWPAMGRSRSFAHTAILTTIGLGTAANALVALVFGGEAWVVPSYVTDTPVHAGSVPIRPIYIVMIVAGAGLTILVDRIIRRTALGNIFRATLEDPEGALLMGIDTRKVVTLSFAVAGGLSALAGFLMAPVINASAYSAQELGFLGFAGMAIGGFGSFPGALAGGVIVGLFYGIVPVFLDPHLAVPILWAVVIAVLMLRPMGLLGTAGLFGSARSREI